MPLMLSNSNPRASEMLIFANGHSVKALAYLRRLAEKSRFRIYFVNWQMLGTFNLRIWRDRPKAQIASLTANVMRKKEKRQTRPHPGRLKALKIVYRPLINLIVSVLWTCYKSYLVTHREKQLIMVWNGTKFGDLILRSVADSLNISVVYFENGILPQTTTLDNKGINAANSLPRDPKFYLARQPSVANLPQKLIARKGRSPLKSISKTPSKNISKNLRGNSPMNQRDRPLPDSYLFVPFQVNRDSQILDHSPWIQNMRHFFTVLCRISPRIKNKKVRLIIKQHPQCSDNYSALHAAAEQEPGIAFAEHSTELLIRNAMAIVTINSTVGIESLLLGKKVIVLGNTYYNLPGLTQQASGEDELVKAIDRLPSWQFNAHLHASFLDYTYQYYCLPDDWRNPSAKHFAAADDRLAKFLAGKSWLPN